MTASGKAAAQTAAVDTRPYNNNVAPIVHLQQGAPVTNSVAIAREFGRRHDNVLQSLARLSKDGTIDPLDFKEIAYLDAGRRKQRMIELTERGALIAMPFIGGRTSRSGQVRLVNAFLAMRDELASQQGNWLASRKNASIGYRAMTDSLMETRAENGKATNATHYMAEAKLVNMVMFGTSKGVDRDRLSQSDLRLLDAVEMRNGYLIARGRTYPQRKAELAAYLQTMRAKRTRLARPNVLQPTALIADSSISLKKFKEPDRIDVRGEMQRMTAIH
jgi:Rha family phage regulatory protein